MLVLGINCYAHDSSAAIVADGRIIAAAEEERFTRKKHTDEFPLEAISYCLKQAGVSLADITHAAFSSDPFLQFRKRLLHGLRFLDRRLLLGRHASTIFLPFLLRKKLQNSFLTKPKPSFSLHYVNHHLAHAASTFFASPFERAAILTVDGAGEWATTVLSRGEGNQITPLLEINYPHSLGLFYGTLTQFLGFRPDFDEGKVMALAAYGKPGFLREFQQLLSFESDGRFRLNLRYFNFHLGALRWYSTEMIRLLGEPRLPGAPLDKRHQDIAATLQRILEQALLRLANELHRRTGAGDVCLAGGVALNCSANGMLLRESPFRRIFVQPASGDAGTSLGSALYLFYALSQGQRERKGGVEHTYLGPEYSEFEMEQALKDETLPYERMSAIEDRVADLLAQGKTVGWFQDRMEFGPRALGARSILADPRTAETRHYLNREIKQRELFRPYGSSVLEEEAHLYFETLQKSPFMLFASKVRPQASPLIPAVVHEDGTSRIQTVSKIHSPRYWKLIQAFKKRTGIPLLLNTSFNLKDEPLVCRPAHAAQSFKKSRLDFLAMGPFLARQDSKKGL